jgi:hypothetical protein
VRVGAKYSVLELWPSVMSAGRGHKWSTEVLTHLPKRFQLESAFGITWTILPLLQWCLKVPVPLLVLAQDPFRESLTTAQRFPRA